MVMVREGWGRRPDMVMVMVEGLRGGERVAGR
jgi:hypothetical protein